jgi:glycosyltransferase involved in cell wall biosynthesis
MASTSTAKRLRERIPGRARLYRLRRRALRSLLIRASRAQPSGGEKVHILLVSAWGMGGTIRAAINLAGYLADQHEVEIISTYRRREEPYVPLDPRVKAVALDDERTGKVPWHLRPARALLSGLPSVLYHPKDFRFHNPSLWTDVQLVRRLRGRRGVVIASRPGHNMLIADLAFPGLVKVGLEQMNYGSHAKSLRKAMARKYPKLDGLAVLTEQDRETYREVLDGSVPMFRIPNTVQAIEPPRADLGAKRILAAGRMTPQKGFDYLVEAFAPVARSHPDWNLKICGSNGVHRPKIEALVAEAGLQDRVDLAGPTGDLAGEMERASIYVLSSRFEGFPLVLIEAMAKGMAVVAFDCPTGPRDIVRDHENGLLIPHKDIAALSAGIAEMIEDEELRRRCGAAAVDAARDYTMAAIGPRWDAMLHELLQAKSAA